MKPKIPLKYKRTMKPRRCFECKKQIEKGDPYHEAGGYRNYHKACWEKRVNGHSTRVTRGDELLALLKKKGPLWFSEMPQAVAQGYQELRRRGEKIFRVRMPGGGSIHSLYYLEKQRWKAWERTGWNSDLKKAILGKNKEWEWEEE